MRTTAKNIKINLHSANSYQAAIKMFNENYLEYYTYQRNEEKSCRIVIRSFHQTITIDYIKEDMESNVFLIKSFISEFN